MKRDVLVLLSHPNWSASWTNKSLIDAIKDIDGLEVRHLEKLYPTYNIDVVREQDALLKSHLVIFQYPFYWYSTPPMLKKYLDDVLLYDFAYGSKGDKLKNKDALISISGASPYEAYTKYGAHSHEIEEFLLPLIRTIGFVSMKYLKSFMFYSAPMPMSKITRECKQKMVDYSNKYREFIKSYIG